MKKAREKPVFFRICHGTACCTSSSSAKLNIQFGMFSNLSTLELDIPGYLGDGFNRI